MTIYNFVLQNVIVVRMFRQYIDIYTKIKVTMNWACDIFQINRKENESDIFWWSLAYVREVLS
jgi:hypothetical protein